MAMLLAEKLGIDGVRELAKIYATDIDEESLKEGRRAVFSVRDTESLPPGFAERYFTIDGPKATLNRDLRRLVMFGRLDLLQDAPISGIDLLLCRNTLMYFNAEAQARVLNRFSFSIDNSGFLVLGHAEMLFSYATMFMPVDLPRRIFRVMAKANIREEDRIRAAEWTRQGGERIKREYALAPGRLRQRHGGAHGHRFVRGSDFDERGCAPAVCREPLGHRQAAPGTRGSCLADIRSAIDRVLAEHREVTIKEVQHAVR